MVVDFPAPFGPRKPKNCPAATLNVTSSTAVNSPNRRVNPRVEIAGVSMARRISGKLRETKRITRADAAPQVRTFGHGPMLGRTTAARTLVFLLPDSLFFQLRIVRV